MDLPGLVLVPSEISGVRNSFAIKVCPNESEKPRIRQKKRPAQRAVRQMFSRFEGRLVRSWAKIRVPGSQHCKLGTK